MSPSSPSLNGFQFSLNSGSTSHFAPRLGTAILRRPDGREIKINTPGLLISASRGLVPHLSRDHCRLTKAIKWVNVPFETFLEHSPPVPTLQAGPNPIHRFLGYSPAQHIVSISARNPSDGHEMPPNGNNHISVQSLRGVRKLAPSDWCNYAHGCRPDIVYALTDTPFTTPPYSQKRLTKSIGRSATWLLNLLTGLHRPADSDRPLDNPSIPGVFVHMAGSTSLPARRAFAESLKERLDGKDAEAVSSLGFKCLDDGVAGYIFDLVPLRLPLSAAQASKTDNSWNGLAETDLNLGLPSTSSPPEGELQEHLEQPPLDPQSNDNIVTSPSPLSSLVRASLIPLPVTKPRMINSATGPLELLRLIGEIGIDLFEVGWAVEAANVGVALDFQFPVPGHSKNTANGSAQVADEGRIVEFKVERANGDPVPKRIGHNLYEKAYTFDFSPLASCFNGAAAPGGLRNICPCAACSPIIPATRIAHDSVISSEEETKGGKAYPYKPAFTRAYIHHLLHTHEMSAHALLVMHNLSVVERFLEGVREVIGSERGSEGFWEEVERFEKVHPDEDREGLMEEARKCWKEVDLARGRGRLKREKERQQEAEVVNE